MDLYVVSVYSGYDRANFLVRAAGFEDAEKQAREHADKKYPLIFTGEQAHWNSEKLNSDSGVLRSFVFLP